MKNGTGWQTRNWFGVEIAAGESRSGTLAVGESYSGATVEIQLQIVRGLQEGPTVFVTAALHGDEINGCGAVRAFIQDENLRLVKGTLILVPVLNVPAFERHSRYLPDRRDLNRSFPGTPDGSLASRMAYRIFHDLASCCDYGIDLHTAAVRRTNYPTVRGDLSNRDVRRLAEAFGSEIVVNSKGPKNSFRREVSQAGCATITMEGGEVWKVEPGIVETAVRGIRNVLINLEMIKGDYEQPPYQVYIEQSKWIRAEHGGFLEFHIQPGDLVEKGQPLTTNTTILGEVQGTLVAPFNGVVMGMTSLPAVSPGKPICNLGKLPRHYHPDRLRKMRSCENGLEQKVLNELGSNVLVIEPDKDQEF